MTETFSASFMPLLFLAAQADSDHVNPSQSVIAVPGLKAWDDPAIRSMDKRLTPADDGRGKRFQLMEFRSRVARFWRSLALRLAGSHMEASESRG